MMDEKATQDLIFNTVKDKSVLKQDVFNNIILNFKILKQVLKEIGDDLSTRIESVDERVIVEYKNTGEFEAQLRVAGDVLIFHMHTNVFKFDSQNSLWNSSYFKENGNRGYCGLINIYNFLNDSIKYNRENDSGYMIGRLFVNSENHFMVEGKRQMGFLYNDIMNSVIDKDKMKAIIQSAVLYTLDFDLFIPPYDEVKEVSVFDIQQLSDKLKLKTAKRLGFQFTADSDSV
jgi:hypothetical protein